MLESVRLSAATDEATRSQLPEELTMENGLLEFGYGEGAVKIVREMGSGTEKGFKFGQGAERFGKSIRAKRIPTVRDQRLAGYDPRGLKGTVVTCATSPMGADHTEGNTLGLPDIVPNEAPGPCPCSNPKTAS